MAPAPEKIAQEGFFKGVTRAPFLRVWGYVKKGHHPKHVPLAVQVREPSRGGRRTGGERGSVRFFVEIELIRGIRLNCSSGHRKTASSGKKNIQRQSCVCDVLRRQQKQEQVVDTDGHTREPTSEGVAAAHSDATEGPRAPHHRGTSRQ